MRKRRMEWEMKMKKKWTNMDRRKEKRPRVGCERQHCFHIYIYIGKDQVILTRALG